MSTLLAAVAVVAAAVVWPAGPARLTMSRAVVPFDSAGVVVPGRPLDGGAHRSRPGAGVVARRTMTLEDVTDALVLVAVALRAPVPVTVALEEAACACSSAAGADLRTVATALRWGVDPVRAWAYVPEVWSPAARALRLASETGAAPADVVETAAARMRQAEARRREERAARAGVLVVLPLGLILLPAFLCTAVLPVVLTVAGTVLQ